MSEAIPADVGAYFQGNSASWNAHFQRVETFRDAADRLRILAQENEAAANDVFQAAMGYVSTAANEISIYQEGLNKLRAGVPSREVDIWLDELGYAVTHNQLGQALVKRIGRVFQNITQVVQNLIQSISGFLNMKLEEISVNFGISPSVSLTFK
ncbi:MAG: hypothetical protein ACE1ZE_04215 [Candidatus Binatia bacterium]